jgi:hypothetical protein
MAASQSIFLFPVPATPSLPGRNDADRPRCDRGAADTNIMSFRILFPIVLLACNFGAAVAYALTGDWRRAVYWAASSICIAAVTF